MKNQLLAGGGDYLEDEERAALHAELEASMAEARDGTLVDADVVLAELRRRANDGEPGVPAEQVFANMRGRSG